MSWRLRPIVVLRPATPRFLKISVRRDVLYSQEHRVGLASISLMHIHCPPTTTASRKKFNFYLRLNRSNDDRLSTQHFSLSLTVPVKSISFPTDGKKTATFMVVAIASCKGLRHLPEIVI